MWQEWQSGTLGFWKSVSSPVQRQVRDTKDACFDRDGYPRHSDVHEAPSEMLTFTLLDPIGVPS